MIDKTKAIIGLVIMLATLIGYIVKLEHRLTVIEQQNIAMQKTLIEIDDGQRQLIQHLFFD